MGFGKLPRTVSYDEPYLPVNVGILQTVDGEDWSGCQHDLARNVLGGLGHEGLSRIRQRVDRADVGPQGALVDESSNVAELGTAGVPNEANRANVDSIGWRRSHDGHERSTGLDDRR